MLPQARSSDQKPDQRNSRGGDANAGSDHARDENPPRRLLQAKRLALQVLGVTGTKVDNAREIQHADGKGDKKKDSKSRVHRPSRNVVGKENVEDAACHAQDSREASDKPYGDTPFHGLR